MQPTKSNLKSKLKKVSENEFEIPKDGNMKVPGKIFMNDKLLEGIDEKTIQQVMNVATLPGIYSQSIAMPDAHMGYGFSVGGVAATDAKCGCISPGGVGYDINCGVRLLQTNLDKEQVYPKVKDILNEMFRRIPCGVGRGGNLKLTKEQFDEVLTKGAKWAVENKLGNEDDLINCEESGTHKDAQPQNVTPSAYKRGKDQLGSLGAGNHFLEIQYVDKVFDKKAAEVFGLKEGQVVAMIHCGSRGTGHQVCSDYLRMIEKEMPDLMRSLVDRELAYAPVDSDLGKKYYGAMCACANYAWCNRHIIGHNIRKSFESVFGVDNVSVKTVYDVAHNMAKLEEHEIDGEMKKVYVHRKGATRSFPKGRPELSEKYKKVGQPVLIPGSMGTSSYVLVGGENSMKISFGSTAHGAGRVMSRRQATEDFDAKTITDELATRNIFVKSASMKGIVEEAPGAYKDVDEVVKVSDALGIGKLVARLKPMGVVKG